MISDYIIKQGQLVGVWSWYEKVMATAVFAVSQLRLLAQQAMDECILELPVQTTCLPPLLLSCQQADALYGEAAALQVVALPSFLTVIVTFLVRGIFRALRTWCLVI